MMFFISKFCVSRCVLTSDREQAEVFFIDMDSVKSADELKRIKQDYPLKPIIHISLHSLECAPHFFIRKPLIVKNLLDTLTKIERLPNRQVVVERLKANYQERDRLNLTLSFNDSGNRYPDESENGQFKPKVLENIGAEVDLRDEKHHSLIYFDPQEYYVFYVQKAVDKAKLKDKAIKLIGLWQTVIICPRYRLVYVTTPDKKLCTLCSDTLENIYKERTLSDHISFDYEYLDNSEEERIFKGVSSEFIIDLDSFLWKISLWTAQGRLPVGTDLKKTFQVQSWPNFTRLTPSPHSFKLTAYWATKPRTLLETVEHLGFKQCHIFSLYSALLVLGNIEKLIADEENLMTPSVTMKAKKIFGKIINKLKFS